MPLHDRAAQFNAFNALNGYQKAVSETARLTENKGDDAAEEIYNILNYISLNIKEGICISITYFVADNKKCGGKYVSKQGLIKSIDNITQAIIFNDGVSILFDDIYAISIEK